jgi:hypothetical protein
VLFAEGDYLEPDLVFVAQEPEVVRERLVRGVGGERIEISLEDVFRV